MSVAEDSELAAKFHPQDQFAVEDTSEWASEGRSSYGGGCGCGCGQSSFALPLLLGALALATWFLNMQITMLGRKRRKRSQQTVMSNLAQNVLDGLSDFESKINTLDKVK